MAKHNTLMTKLRISEEEEIEVPLHFEMDEFLPSALAHHMLVQGSPDHIILSFFEANFPYVIDHSPEAIEQIKQEGYDAECVAKVVIPNSRVADFAKVFAEMAERLSPKESDEPNGHSE